MFKITFILLFFFIISACSSSYKELKNIDSQNTNLLSDNLLKLYKEKAIFEAEQMHDWNSVKLYSEKALNANKGIEIKPQKISYWNLPQNKFYEIKKSYQNLMSVYNDAKFDDPYNLAVAITSLDCWAEQQEENWQTWDINECRDDFLNAMHNIYDNLALSKKNYEENKIEKSNEVQTESVAVVTKNKKNDFMQIIYFDFDEATLSEVSLNIIKKYIEKNKNKIKNFTILGHTDTKGTKEYNLKLSLKRAEKVKNILIKEGINEKNISIVGKGEKTLAVFTKDEVRHPANRRVEIRSSN